MRITTRKRLSLTVVSRTAKSQPAKLLADRIWRFSEVPQTLWLKFPDAETYKANAQEVDRILNQGQQVPDADQAPPAERISIYAERPKSVKNLVFDRKMYLPETMIRTLEEAFGAENVSLTPGKLMIRDQLPTWNR